MTNQITTVVVFHTDSALDRFWAFKQVPLAPFHLRDVEGLTFVKSMGSGGGKGFDFTPSFGTYAWLLVWETHQHAELFFSTHNYFLRYKRKCKSIQTFVLKNVISHGKWSGLDPFQKGAELDEFSKVVVLTRARIKWNRLWQFWSKVGRTANELYKFPELEFAIGIGELPFIQQATISIWKNYAAMKHYAYTDETHRNVIQLTKKHQWYSEELFARFILVSENVYTRDKLSVS